MKLLTLAVAFGSLLTVGPQSPGAESFPTRPPAAWSQGDPADSVYRRARRALDEKEYTAAARLFESIVTRFPRSDYAPDALYWKGYALYKDGNLDGAVEALEAQAQRFPRATTRSDAASLLMTVKGEQAKRGDAVARRDVNTAAQASTGCQDMEVQIAALDAVQQMDPDRALPLLRRVLARRDSCSLPLRKNALFILGQRAGSDRETTLLDIAKTDPASEMRSDAVFYLSQAKSDLAVDALESVLLTANEQSVRANALFALAQMRSERARKILRDFAVSDNAPVSLRNDAIFHLAQRKDDADVAWLAEAYAKVTDAQVRDNIMFHIAQRSGDDVNKWLTSVVLDPKEGSEQRKNALFHLTSRKSATAEVLGAVYDGTTSATVKKDLIFYLGQSRDPKALDKLIAIAKRDPSTELRKEALFHIGQSKDPRALKALEEIVSP